MVSEPAAAGAQAASHGQAQTTEGPSEVDLFMERVFDNRDASWRRLGDFIMRETEVLTLEASAHTPSSGFRREYEWYFRDGVAVRSPVRFDGIDIDEARRRDYEARWLREEHRRRELAAELDESRLEAGAGDSATGAGRNTDDAVSLDASRLEPRFVADYYYFTEFTFEPGSYYFAGRETVAGREVVRIEYYPTDQVVGEFPERLLRGVNKTSLITFWVDPEVHQIVKYTLDNAGLDFLPLRWLARIDGFEASMEMAPIGDLWMPARMTIAGHATTAVGEMQMTFTVAYSDYREAETGARLVGPESPGIR